MSLYAKLDKYILLPISAKMQKSNIVKEYASLRQTDWYSEEQLMNLQNDKLQRLIHHCYTNVPYYTKLFNDLGLKPEDIQCRTDLVKLPILTKQIIRDNYNDLISLDVTQRNAHEEVSGGSTGEPLKFMTDKATWGIKWSSSFRAWRWFGFHVGERIFTFGGNSLVKTEREKKKITKKDIFDKFIMNNLKCDCSDMSDEAMLSNYKKLMRYRPSVIRGYPAAICNLAKFINERKLMIPKVRLVLTTGEMLLSQHRYTIQKVFRVPVYDSYGAGDGGIISHECYMHEGLHITEEQCVVEITDSIGNIKADGESGFVLTTDLDNYVFPFIRYQVGDMAIIKKQKCSCGRSSRLIEQIIGRTGKTLYNKAGQPFTSIVIDNMMFKNMDYHRQENEEVYLKIDQFQVRQNKEGDICILIKPKDLNESLSTFDYVIDNFTKHFLGSNIELKFVVQIPKMASGKEDYCISEYEPKETY
jgi:phenylacetate-CoA ligase